MEGVPSSFRAHRWCSVVKGRTRVVTLRPGFRLRAGLGLTVGAYWSERDPSPEPVQSALGLVPAYDR